MSKPRIQTVNGIKIFPIDYLMNVELSDNDLSNLLDNDKIGLKYSLIINMFRFIEYNKRSHQIIKMIKSDNNWYDKFSWSISQREEYENKLINVYKNIYQYGNVQSKSLAQWFTTVYGFNIK